MAVHIFWDLSNVWSGAQELRKAREGDVPRFRLRMMFPHLHDLVASGRETGVKVMYGDAPSECMSLLEQAREAGYDTSLARLADQEDPGPSLALRDQVFLLRMANAVLDNPAPQTMALVSGDARMTQFGMSLPDQLRRVLASGWSVEVYAWDARFNNAKYQPLKDEFGDLITFVMLDERYDQLTYVTDGGYYTRDDEGQRIYIQVSERPAKGLA